MFYVLFSAQIDRTLLFARPPVLSAARVKENCFSLSFIAAPSCQTWLRASTGNYCRVSGGFAPSPRAWAGGSGRTARQCARSGGALRWAGHEQAGGRQQPGSKPLWKRAVLSWLEKRGQTVDWNSSCAHGSSARAGWCWCCPPPQRWSTDLAPLAMPIMRMSSRRSPRSIT